LSTKIHVLCDALGNPTGFHLTGGNAHDLMGADALLPGLKAQALLADKAYHAQKRVIQPPEARGIAIVIPPKRNHKNPRPYDKDLYKTRHLIENFFCKLKRFRSIATRYDKTKRNFQAAIYAAAFVLLTN
jgi:transposase